MINLQIEEIEKHYVELIEILNEESPELEFVRIKTAALSMAIFSKHAILKDETRDNPENKLKLNKTINALKSVREPLNFRTFTATFQEITEGVEKSYLLFKEKFKST